MDESELIIVLWEKGVPLDRIARELNLSPWLVAAIIEGHINNIWEMPTWE
jgi:hypothetical protein